MIRLFVESRNFTTQVEDLGGKDLLIHIQDMVLQDLALPMAKRDLIPGSGGFAKVRVSDPRNTKGKSGGLRVIYFDLEEHKVCFLMLVYSKSVKENLTPGQLAQLKATSQELRKWRPKKRSK